MRQLIMDHIFVCTSWRRRMIVMSENELGKCDSESTPNIHLLQGKA